MTAFNHAAFFAALRTRLGPLKQEQVDIYNAALAAGLGIVSDPAWVGAGRSKIGEREIKGPKHNPFIVGMWQLLGAPWLKTDEDAWCGGFVAWCMATVKLPYPKLYPQAASWAKWGDACLPQPGAVGVKARSGGNHVFIIVGITADGKFYLALGGNQNDGVSIAPVPVHEVYAVRWPAGVPQPNIALPIMEKTTTTARES